MLIASRRRLAALEDAAVISLDTLIPGEPAELLACLAGRPGLQAAAAVGEITRLCGHLPLATGMLARQPGLRRAASPAADAARPVARTGRGLRGELPLYATLTPAAISDFLQIRRRGQRP